MEGLEGRIRKSNSIAFSRPGFCGTGRRMQRGAQVRRCRCAKRVPLPMQSFPPLLASLQHPKGCFYCFWSELLMEGLEGRIRKSNSIAFSRPGFCGTGRRTQHGMQARPADGRNKITPAGVFRSTPAMLFFTHAHPAYNAIRSELRRPGWHFHFFPMS